MLEYPYHVADDRRWFVKHSKLDHETMKAIEPRKNAKYIQQYKLRIRDRWCSIPMRFHDPSIWLMKRARREPHVKHMKNIVGDDVFWNKDLHVLDDPAAALIRKKNRKCENCYGEELSFHTCFVCRSKIKIKL